MKWKEFLNTLVVSGLLCSTPAFAEKHYSKTDEDDKEDAKRDDSSSISNREGKQFSVAGEVVGFASVVPSMGARGEYFLNRDGHIEVGYARGKLPFLFVDIASSFTHVNYKQFFGNSFYMRGGLAYRSLKVSSGSLFSDLIDANKTLSTVEAIGPDIAIGNQWQWENFTMGCDWFGYYFPISILSSSENFVSGAGEDAKAQAKDLNQKFGKISSPEVLRFYLGASF